MSIRPQVGVQKVTTYIRPVKYYTKTFKKYRLAAITSFVCLSW